MDTNLLFALGATSRITGKGEVIFNEGDFPRYYYQIISGKVKMFNVNAEGKEYTQGIFEDGDSFGEIPLFIDREYPAGAVSTQKSVLLQLPKDRFLQLLKEDNELQHKFLLCLATRTYMKALNLRNNINSSAEHRVLCLLNEYRRKKEAKQHQRILIDLTRQEIAGLTGMRVETVIRTIIDLKDKEIVAINDRKLYY